MFSVRTGNALEVHCLLVLTKIIQQHSTSAYKEENKERGRNRGMKGGERVGKGMRE